MGGMVMIKADSNKSVKGLYDMAIELGASDEGPPGDRLGGDVYAAYIGDLDGNNVGFMSLPNK